MSFHVGFVPYCGAYHLFEPSAIYAVFTYSTPLGIKLCKRLCSHRIFVVPWGGLNIVRCYSLDCLNVSGGLLVADAEMRLCAAPCVLALTPFADVHAASI